MTIINVSLSCVIYLSTFLQMFYKWEWKITQFGSCQASGLWSQWHLSEDGSLVILSFLNNMLMVVALKFWVRISLSPQRRTGYFFSPVETKRKYLNLGYVFHVKKKWRWHPSVLLRKKKRLWNNLSVFFVVSIGSLPLRLTLQTSFFFFSSLSLLRVKTIPRMCMHRNTSIT